jgi:hypothetical protein
MLKSHHRRDREELNAEDDDNRSRQHGPRSKAGVHESGERTEKWLC